MDNTTAFELNIGNNFKETKPNFMRSSTPEKTVWPQQEKLEYSSQFAPDLMWDTNLVMVQEEILK